MNTNFYKKIILSFVIIITSFSYLLIPNKTQAFLGFGDVVTDPGNTIQGTITAGNTTLSAANTMSLQLKEYVLDGLVTNILKQIVRQITASVVNWINSGFEGSPSFLQNPGAFFLDAADQITGDFLSKYGGSLSNLCSPFSIDIRLALAFKYHPKIQQRYSCTLGKIIENVKNIPKNSTINGFTAGDFKQGGWPAFVSLTTEPQNNFYGAYLTANSELSISVASAKAEKKDELNQGRGFLSYRDCKSDGSDAAYTADQNLRKISAGTKQQQATNEEEINLAKAEVKRHQTCNVLTPGSVIAGTLDKQLGVPADALNLADEVNEIVDALFAQLVTQVLQKGLGAVSGSGPGDSTSYISQIQNEAVAAEGGQLGTMKSSLLKDVEPYIKYSTDYLTIKKNILNTISDTKNKYDEVKACYTAAINTTSIDPYQKEYGKSKIEDIDKIITRDIALLATKALSDVEGAELRLGTINEIQNKANSAQTFNDLNIPSASFAQLIQTQSLTTSRDTVLATDELNDTISKTNPMRADADKKLRECRLFPAVLTP